MSLEQLLGTVGILVSLALEYLPKFSTWYQALADNYQRLFTLGVGAGFTLLLFGLSCLPVVLPFEVPFVCTNFGFQTVVDLLWAFGGYVLFNQAAYLVLPRKAGNA